MKGENMKQRLMRFVLVALFGAVVTAVQKKMAQRKQAAEEQRRQPRAPVPAEQS